MTPTKPLIALSEPPPEAEPAPRWIAPPEANGYEMTPALPFEPVGQRAAPPTDLSLPPHEADTAVCLPLFDEPPSVLDGLDPSQRKAAEITHGPLLIMAGPGTGKTRTLTHRIAHLVADRGVMASQCLAVTFTQRAARQMTERLATLLSDADDSVEVLTFHGLGLSILREYGHYVGLLPSFRVAGEGERVKLLADLLSESMTKAGRHLRAISRTKRGNAPATTGPKAAEIYDRYQTALSDARLVDFDDLIRLAVEVLETQPEIRQAYQRRYPWVSIDEYQDIDPRQYRLVGLLVPTDGNICAIGDPDQAIYGFRGTDFRFFQSFREDFPTAQVVSLTRNYRSGKNIVDGAVQLIAPSTLVPDRALRALTPSAHRIVLHSAASARAEAEHVVHAIERMMGGVTFFSLDSGRVEGAEDSPSASDDTLSFSDFSALYRTDVQADALCEAFARSGMPYQRHSHDALIDRPTVQSLLTPMSEGPNSAPLSRRLVDALDTLPDNDVPYAKQVVESLRPLADRCGTHLDRFQTALATTSDADLWDPRADRISLLTLHASKGLEFRVVFIVGCEDGLLPLRFGRSAPATQEVEEERRLLFVGMTRARERLFLSHAQKRTWRRRPREMSVSPFLAAIDDKLLHRDATRISRRPAAPPQEQLTFF